ncbi:hypothetical protein MKY84_05615 [Chryseomicrobium sp. FSL W7-1435]|uniref:hypothetical protein n=1 Tax=Chryseomicrobium sp. FSL W7-1435 TaxID=2921704 RepID=UPI00315A022E
MTYRFFIVIFFSMTLVPLLIIGSFSYWIDPLWSFSHKHDYNDVQAVIDERQQKVNELYFGDNDFDTLLIGSSRTTYVPANKFEGMDVYNFSASDLSFLEYRPMIEFAQQQNNQPFERIILGVDFFKSSEFQSEKAVDLAPYIEKVQEPFYRWKNLISLDVFDYAKRNYDWSAEGRLRTLRQYNRDNIAEAREFEQATIEKETAAKVEKFRAEFYGDNYRYDSRVKEELEAIQSAYPNAELIVFTTPISTPLYETLVEEGNLPDYERWLEDLKGGADEVYHFMYPNSVTNNLANYFDGHHFYPHIGEQIAKTISTGEIEGDFGQILSNKN